MNRFKVFWFARTFSYLGDFIFGMTITWFGLQQGGAWEVAAIASMSMIFRALGSFLLAPLINYMGSRIMIVSSDMLRGLMNVLFWLIVYDHVPYASWTLTVVCLNSFLGGGFDSGMQAYIPTIASELRKANADLSVGRSTVQLLGYVTGGALMQWFYGVGFLLNALTFVVAAVISYFIGGGKRTLHDKIVRNSLGEIFKKLAENWVIAWRTLQGSASLRLAFWTTIFIAAFTVPMLSLMAPLVQQSLGGNSLLFSVIQSATVIGSLIGAAWVRRSKRKDAHMLIIGSLACGVVGLVAATSHLAVILMLTMAIFGFGQAMYNISESTIIQQNEPHLRASIYAILQVANMVLFPISSLSLAHVVTLTSPRMPFLIGGIMVTIGTLFCAWRWFVSNREGKSNPENAEVPM